MEAERIIYLLLEVLHPGVVGLIANNHGEECYAEACAAIQTAKEFLGKVDALPANGTVPARHFEIGSI